MRIIVLLFPIRHQLSEPLHKRAMSIRKRSRVPRVQSVSMLHHYIWMCDSYYGPQRSGGGGGCISITVSVCPSQQWCFDGYHFLFASPPKWLSGEILRYFCNLTDGFHFVVATSPPKQLIPLYLILIKYGKNADMHHALCFDLEQSLTSNKGHEVLRSTFTDWYHFVITSPRKWLGRYFFTLCQSNNGRMQMCTMLFLLTLSTPWLQ